MTIHTDALLDLLARVDELEADPVAKRRFRDLIYQIGAVHKVPAIERQVRIEFAAGLTNARVSVASIRDRLIARFAIGKRQAYRDIESALKLRQKPPDFGARD